jgi:hypothetical protein
MKYTRFEELPCWQDARKLSKIPQSVFMKIMNENQ